MPFVNAQELSVYRKCSVEDAQRFLDAELARALDNHQGCKDNRPWHIVNFTKMLPKDQPWIGFEFETGFDDKDDYNKFIHFLWGKDYVAIDREGTGQYPVEVAFPPQALSDVDANTHLLEQTVRYVHEQGMKPALNPTTFTRRDVGIHAGISTPRLRDGTIKGGTVQRLDDIIQSLSQKERTDVYGRSKLLWGGAFLRGGYGGRGTPYVEIKTFKAIPEVDRVQRYITTVKQMIVLLEWLHDNPQVDKIKNAYEFLRGDTNKIKV